MGGRCRSAVVASCMHVHCTSPSGYISGLGLAAGVYSTESPLHLRSFTGCWARAAVSFFASTETYENDTVTTHEQHLSVAPLDLALAYRRRVSWCRLFSRHRSTCGSPFHIDLHMGSKQSGLGVDTRHGGAAPPAPGMSVPQHINVPANGRPVPQINSRR